MSRADGQHLCPNRPPHAQPTSPSPTINPSTASSVRQTHLHLATSKPSSTVPCQHRLPPDPAVTPAASQAPTSMNSYPRRPSAPFCPIQRAHQQHTMPSMLHASGEQPSGRLHMNEPGNPSRPSCGPPHAAPPCLYRPC
ncbi:hypothetical protein ACLOJK_018543 [Asimina triloba]